MVRDFNNNPLKIIAVCKTFSGNEFITAMIESIYNHVNKIVFVNSNVSWTNKIGNDVKPLVLDWKKRGDVFDKILNLEYNTNVQSDQYDFAYKYINENYDYDFLMLVDTDEIWNNKDILEAKKFLEKTYNDNINAYTTQMRTYIKSPFYRLKNIEPCRPTIFIKKGFSIEGVRGNKITPRVNIPNIFMHHFTYVRSNDELVFDKIKSSTLSDGLKTVDLDVWKKEKWDLLPDNNITDLHTSSGYENYWKGVELITSNDLPDVFKLHLFDIIQTNKPIKCGFIKNYDAFIRFRQSDYYKNLPYGELVLEDEKILFDVSSKCKDILEIGTFKGRSSLILNKFSNVDTMDIFENIDYIKDAENKEHYSVLFNNNPHKYEDIKKYLNKKSNTINVIYRTDDLKLAKKYDAIFFDGDHSYEGLKKDFNEFYNLLNENGYLVFHDSVETENSPHYGVYKFINTEIKPKFKKLFDGGSTTVWLNNRS